MPISFDSALGVHAKALTIYSRRAELLASNLANADTPGYKAKDIDFKAAINASVNAADNTASTGRNYATRSAGGLDVTSKRHIQLASQDRVSISQSAIQTLYREPNQASLDGNTVDSQLEKSAFAENAMRYQASLSFLSGKFKGMLAAIKGE